MRAFYNEIDRYCCDWLQNLMDAGHITPGKIDDRSITDLSPDDVRGYERCHFFAGIAGWELALSLSGYAGPVWTGSCPCQPFSTAGKGKAGDDERHLWPRWFSLIRECRPRAIFGEQVEAAIGWGWLDLVFADLEAEGYACGAAVLPACSVGAPHIRQRLWFVADAPGSGWEASDCTGGSSGRNVSEPDRRSRQSELADADGGNASAEQQQRRQTASGGELSALGNADRRRCEQRDEGERGISEPSAPITNNPWSDLIWLPCTDGKQRPTQPGIFPLAHGLSARVGRLRATGNAIVPQVAAAFIRAACAQ